MPVMDGRNATLAIRAQKRPDAQTVPIRIMTADGLVEDRTELLRAGAADVVYKPVDMIRLRDLDDGKIDTLADMAKTPEREQKHL